MKLNTWTIIIFAAVAYFVLRTLKGNTNTTFTGVIPQRGTFGSSTGLYGPSDGLPVGSGVAYS